VGEDGARLVDSQQRRVQQTKNLHLDLCRGDTNDDGWNEQDRGTGIVCLLDLICMWGKPLSEGIEARPWFSLLYLCHCGLMSHHIVYIRVYVKYVYTFVYVCIHSRGLPLPWWPGCPIVWGGRRGGPRPLEADRGGGPTSEAGLRQALK
jgi:hypothetical protein